MNRRQPTHRPAAVLVLALLLMSAIIGSSIALSIVISDSGRQSSTLNNFITASLAADSGLERGLAVVKAGRVSQPKLNTTNAVGISLLTAPNYFAVSATSPSANSLSWSKLLPRESVTFDYIKGLSTDTLSSSLTIGASTGSGKIDVSWLGLKVGDNTPLFTGRAFISVPAPAGSTIDLLSSPYLYDLDGIQQPSYALASTGGYRIRLTAMQPDLSGLTDPADIQEKIEENTLSNLTVVSPAASPSGFPSRISITSTGQVNNSQATKTASVAWQLPTSPVFNYVVFTEGTIIPE